MPDTLPGLAAPPKYSEKDLTRDVLSEARKFGWWRAHFRSIQDHHGVWKTPVQGDGAGFLDLLMIRGHELLVVELKVGRNKMTPQQEIWFARWQAVPGAEVYVWTEKEWRDGTIIKRLLRQPGKAAAQIVSVTPRPQDPRSL